MPHDIGLTFGCRQNAVKTAHVTETLMKGLIMANRSRSRLILPLAALGLAGMLGGCVAYPDYPAYPAYGYRAPYYGGGYVGLGGGWGHEGGWEHEGGRGWGHGGGWRR